MSSNERWLKAELHTHTLDDPIDGGRMVSHSAHQLIDVAADQGYEILSITNHDQLCYTEELKGYAESRDILLIPGVEATINGKHILLYNFLDYKPGWDDIDVVARRKGEEQLIVAPHPFYPISTAMKEEIYQWAPCLDAIEYSGFYWYWPNFNRRARKVATKLGLPMIGSSDLHFLFQLGLTCSFIYSEKETPAVVSAVRAGKVQLKTGPTPLRGIAVWQLIAFREKLFSFASSQRRRTDETFE